jgi:hypothetical protein
MLPGDKIATGGQKLAELDEGRSHLLEVARQLRRVLLSRDVVACGSPIVGHPHQVSVPVLHEETGDIAVARQMTGLQRDTHHGAVPTNDRGLYRPGG